MPKITRRTFTVCLGAVTGIGVLKAAGFATANHFSYSVRSFRITRRGRRSPTALGFWVRALDKLDFTNSVPVTLQLATDPAGKKIIWQTTKLATNDNSHIVRAETYLMPDALLAGTTVYCSVTLGNSEVAQSIFPLIAAG